MDEQCGMIFGQETTGGLKIISLLLEKSSEGAAHPTRGGGGRQSEWRKSLLDFKAAIGDTLRIGRLDRGVKSNTKPQGGNLPPKNWVGPATKKTLLISLVTFGEKTFIRRPEKDDPFTNEEAELGESVKKPASNLRVGG